MESRVRLMESRIKPMYVWFLCGGCYEHTMTRCEVNGIVPLAYPCPKCFDAFMTAMSYEDKADAEYEWSVLNTEAKLLKQAESDILCSHVTKGIEFTKEAFDELIQERIEVIKAHQDNYGLFLTKIENDESE